MFYFSILGLVSLSQLLSFFSIFILTLFIVMSNSILFSINGKVILKDQFKKSKSNKLI